MALESDSSSDSSFDSDSDNLFQPAGFGSLKRKCISSIPLFLIYKSFLHCFSPFEIHIFYIFFFLVEIKFNKNNSEEDISINDLAKEKRSKLNDTMNSESSNSTEKKPDSSNIILFDDDDDNDDKHSSRLPNTPIHDR